MPIFRDLELPLPAALQRGLRHFGIDQLYSHQAEAIESVRRGEHVVVVTPTASGKSLTYLLPILESLIRTSDSSALLLFPLKALEQDQRGKIEEWQPVLGKDLPFTVAVYDGDTPRSQREKIKANPPHFLISNPDMLHHGILAYYQGWEKLLRRLRYVVIDELHAYRGVFGSHIVQVLRRLSRLLAYYGVDPQFICLSATIANPLELSQALIQRPCTLIAESGAPTSGKHLLFVKPTASTTSTVTRLLITALDHGLRTLVFSKARVNTEVIHRTLVDARPDLAARVSSYRAGFLPEERREIEHKLASGELGGVVSTSALELGIDIGGLDVCILAGYPGSMMSFWQRAGRVGRRGEKSVIVFVAGNDALDHYVFENHDEFLQRACESARVNQHNEEILRAHLPAAAAEIPLMENDPYLDVQAYGSIIAGLEREGLLLRSASGKQWFPGRRRPQASVSLRNIGGTFEIHGVDKTKPMGEISGSAVFRECHPGAIYLHRGEQYLVMQLDMERKRVEVRPTDTTFYTMVRSEKETEIIDDRERRAVRGFVIHHGMVKVTETFHSYERRRIYSQELLSVESLDLPPQSYVTSSVWIELPGGLGDTLGVEELHFMGGIHALEHAAISLIPLFALCDRGDVGGISFTRHPQLTNGAIFFYDGFPGGAGISDHVYAVIEEVLDRCRSLIGHCSCAEGCPSCIQSPKCGSGNKPLDKRAALRVLDVLMSDAVGPVHSEAAAKPPRARRRVPVVDDLASKGFELPVDRRIAVFDLETQLSADDVGGWTEARLMRLAVAAVWDSLEGRTFVYDEGQVADLLAHLKRADLVVGFNVRRFDYEVLRGYTFENLQGIPTVDLLEVVTRVYGKRVKLESIAKATLGAGKSADGLQSIAWFKQGRLDLVTEYCVHDVEITRDLLLYAAAHGVVLCETIRFGVVRIPLGPELQESVLSAMAVAHD